MGWKKTRLLIVSNYDAGLPKHRIRAFEWVFEGAFAPPAWEIDWDVVDYWDLADQSTFDSALAADGLILSGSPLSLAPPGGAGKFALHPPRGDSRLRGPRPQPQVPPDIRRPVPPGRVRPCRPGARGGPAEEFRGVP
ncbi:MAG: hypothetical protein ACTSU5_08110 [Promethearchaeota archaeon]